MCSSGFDANRSCRTAGATPTITIGLRVRAMRVGAELQQLSDRILAGKQACRQRGVDDHRRRAADAHFFGGGELAAAQHRHAERPEVVRRRRHTRARATSLPLAAGSSLLQARPFALHHRRHGVVAERQHRRGAGGDTRSGSRSQALEDRAPCFAALDAVVAAQPRIDLRDHGSGSSCKSRIGRCARSRAAHEQAAQHQQRERQRELRGDERAAHGDAAADAARHFAGLVLQRRQQVGPRQPQRRPQPEANRRQRAEQQRRHEHASYPA